MTIFRSTLSPQEIYWAIWILFAVVIALEYLTPPEYVFGYLNIGTILLANYRFSRKTVFIITIIACAFTLVNLVFPGVEAINPPTLANRLITVVALIVTAILSERNRRNKEMVANAQAKLLSQEKLSRMREDFVSTLTHDLKTPLLGAIETLKSLQKGLFGEITPIQSQVFATMTRSFKTTLQLVETLLDVYRNDTEGLRLQCEPVNLATIAEEAVTNIIPLARTRQVYVSLNYGESDFRRYLWVNGDTLQLGRVFTNLLVNAVNHTPRGGKVELVLDGHSNYNIVKILDNGCGITPEELPYLFERFYQGNSHRLSCGSGLGLYLTRQIIEAHKGIIWAENRLPRGAAFGFKIPACPPK